MHGPKIRKLLDLKVILQNQSYKTLLKEKLCSSVRILFSVLHYHEIQGDRRGCFCPQALNSLVDRSQLEKFKKR